MNKVVLATLVLLASSAAQAQRAVRFVEPIRLAPLAGISGLSPARMPMLSQPAGLSLPAPTMNPTLAPALTPTIRPLPALTVASPALSIGAQNAMPAQTLKGETGAALSKTGAEIIQAAGRPGAEDAFGATLDRLFDSPGGPGGGKASFRSPDQLEDARINQALGLLGRSSVGASVYREIYNRWGSRLTIHVDNDPRASYDSRLIEDAQAPKIFLTESLLRESPEAVAAYIARAMAHLYYAEFPESAERSYMAYGVMVRTFAEITDSGLNSTGGWWDTARDQRSGGAYAIQRYYGSWKEAAQSGDPRYSAFFRFLQTGDDSQTGPNAKLSLLDQYYRGLIDYTTYWRMTRYFNQITRSETQWLNDTGRW